MSDQQDLRKRLYTAYCIKDTTHHIVASALRMITGCVERPDLATTWQAAPWCDDQSGDQRIIATSYHCAPVHHHWVIVYPNVPHAVPFAAALSRQTRRITIGLTNQRHEAWDRGHPLDLPDDAPTDVLDARYFRDYRLPPVADWSQWIHLWHPRWQG